MRKTLVALLVVASGCGTVCDGASAAETGANQKAQNCSNVQPITVHDANKCNMAVNSKCTADDISGLKNYAACLNNLPVCTSDNEVSFSFSRSGCTSQALSKVSLTCLGAIL